MPRDDSQHHARAHRARLGVPSAALVAALLLAGCGLTGTGTPDPGTPSPTAATSSSTAEAASPSPEPTSPPTPTPTPRPTPSARATPAPTPTPRTTDEPAPSPSVKPSPAPSPRATASPSAEPTEEPDDGVLRAGDAGADVTALQQRLVDLGYWGTAVDGSFGNGTTQAVWAFQKAAGLARDGVVGPATQAALDRGVRPKAHSSSGHVVEIDLDRQLVLLVDDGAVRRILNASSGSGETFETQGATYRARTPRGTFAVYRQIDAMHESTLELGSMYRPKYFTGGIALHGSGSIPPYPASHGCVRVSNGAMDYVWDRWGAPVGTSVLVY
ncbi:peptidoglycan-binding protein [Cellulomonas sp. PhB143]|uniref:peptidoglycan-binding protein n=1 Tax=Cellulomonas sp. PhB143 TaxID=2485186 RepID=UPI000FB5A015|nr:peptidoglycan-binding protein [Cellulomonas sp. PhB143]ROS76757.1 L,D-transpeptidase-like protein [Cellulomonas sp. PhB143]